jgi:hypothetical protein
MINEIKNDEIYNNLLLSEYIKIDLILIVKNHTVK